ncbi:unnamed protein product [Rotaria socialis]|uniref:Uncharacterized protein n=1 Tax=Rotaria socialis TaxID=392032 RepID=A0A820S4S7_9BILA|nr:unnamed protein product [Rotaria socialis]
MPFIDFKCIDVQSLDESSTITAEEIQQDKAVRQSNFMRALEMANTIIDHNPEVLVFYWYMWTCRDRTYSNSLPPEQITRRTVKRMPVPTEEEQLLFNTQRRSADPPKATYEVGEIFETMLFGGTAVRYNENEIRRCGDADDNEAHFFINDDRQYHRFFITYDLAILRYIPKRKRQFITIRQHVTNITSMQRQQINN